MSGRVARDADAQKNVNEPFVLVRGDMPSSAAGV